MSKSKFDGLLKATGGAQRKGSTPSLIRLKCQQGPTGGKLR